jgi:hypothetical protein
MWTAPRVNCQLRHASALRSNGRARATAFAARTSVLFCFMAGSHRHLRFSSPDKIRHGQTEQIPTWHTTACHGISCNKRRLSMSPNWHFGVLQCVITSADPQKPWLTLARTCQRWRRDPVSCALMSGLCDAALAAGHHGCALTCQAPICLACSKHTASNGMA